MSDNPLIRSLDNPLGRGSGVGPGLGTTDPATGLTRRNRRISSNPRVIPNANVDHSGQLRPNMANEIASASSAERAQLMVAGLNATIPILYGGPERLGGKLYVVKQSGQYMWFSVILCEGEVEQIGTAAGDTSTNGIFLNDVDLAGGLSIVVKKYVGTPGQGVDPTLAAMITTPVAYTETLANTAYVVVTATGANAGPGFPRLTFSVKGRKVYDPRENRIPWSNTLGSWTQGGTCGAAQNANGPWGATNYLWTLTDSDAANHAYRTTAFVVPNNSATYAIAFKVRKTSGGTSPTCYLTAGIGGGAGGNDVAAGVLLNTDTGAFANVNTAATVIEVGKTGDRCWLVEFNISNNSTDNTALGLAIYPAVNTFGNLSVGAATVTGANVFGETQVRLSTAPRGYVETPDTNPVLQPTRWSDNAALCLGDFLANTTFGEGRTVNSQSLATAAEYCDEMLGTAGQPNEKRSTMTLLLDSKLPKRSWRDTIRQYTPCWVVIDNGQAYLRIDRDEPVDHTFTTTGIRQQPLVEVSRGGFGDIPNQLVLSYTDTSVTPFRTTTLEVNTGANPKRPTRLDLPGLRGYARARRYAIQRLNHYTLEELTGSFPAFDEGLKVLDGDIIQITDASVGLAAQKARVLSVQDEEHGRWIIAFRAHDPASFSDAVIAAPTTPTTGPPNPNVIPPVTGLALFAERYQESGVWKARIRATWDPADLSWPWVTGYIVELFEPAVSCTYAPAAGSPATRVEVTFPGNHNKSYNDVAYIDWSDGAALDGGYGVAFPDAVTATKASFNHPGGTGTGTCTVKWIREYHIREKAEGTTWLSQPVILDVNYTVRVRVRSAQGPGP